MKHLKTFEELDQDFGRFSNEDEYREEDFEQIYDNENEEDDTNYELGGEYNELGQDEDDYGNSDEDEEDGEEHDWNDSEIVESRIMSWSEISEKKKTNPGFQAYLDKQKAKKEEKDSKGKKDDKKSDKDSKEDKKEVKGLTAKQRKLPEAMQKAILKRQKK